VLEGELEGETAGVLNGQLDGEAGGSPEGELDSETTGVLKSKLDGMPTGMFEGKSDSDGEITGMLPKTNMQTIINPTRPPRRKKTVRVTAMRVSFMNKLQTRTFTIHIQ
jgi:hypothetical protein